MKREFEPLDASLYTTVAEVTRQAIESDENLHITHDGRESLMNKIDPMIIKYVHKGLWLTQVAYEMWKERDE